MAEITLMPIDQFVGELEKALERKDGYIMGATGQNPRKWASTSWWFTQYDNNPSQKAKALYWREHAERVWDCNGLAEGIYKDFSGVDINTKARYNYAQWCDIKAAGMIPKNARIPGAAVFWGDTAGSITHVAYLEKPVKEGEFEGDWYLIEARGVMNGVVQTKLNTRKPQYWGYMTKYFDYTKYFNGGEITYTVEEELYDLGDRNLKNGSEGNDVKELQTYLIQLGYDLGIWGADGDFGDCTENAVKEFQKAKKLVVDGIVGAKTLEAIRKALVNQEKPINNPTIVLVTGGTVNVRTGPSTTCKILGVAKKGTELAYQGTTDENDWHLVQFDNKNAWISGRYSKLMK